MPKCLPWPLESKVSVMPIIVVLIICHVATSVMLSPYVVVTYAFFAISCHTIFYVIAMANIFYFILFIIL